jgi:hypothetical protein
MIVWILILVLWIALFSLILHDATKHDPDGSAVSMAAKTFAAFLSSTAKKLRAAFKKSTSLLHGISSSLSSIPRDMRVSITAMELESAITQTVKSEPGCEEFVGVIVQPKAPKSRLDPNWEVLGVRFGKADRKIANEPLVKAVGRLQQEFRLAGHRQGAPRAP